MGEKTLPELLAEQETAGVALESAREEEQRASSARTRALNSYNEITKQIDEVLKKLKATAPRDTDWARTNR